MTLDAYCALGVDREFNLTADALLASLDQAGVDAAVVAPTDRQLAVDNREGNDFLLRTARVRPRRFVASCTANPWYGRAAVDEATRAIAEGARVLILHPFVQGYVADDELVWPMLDLAAGEQVPVYLHTGPHGSATPFQVMNLARRYSTVDFIIGHCGATDYWYDAVAAARGADNCYLEASLARPFNFSNYISQLGAARGIMGSFAPINDLAFEWESMRRVLSGPENEDVYGANLQRLIEKKKTPMIIDCHTHWGLLWEERDRGDPTRWLQACNRHGVDVAFLYGHANLHRLDWCGAGNDLLTRIAARAPGRLVPIGTSWLQMGEEAVAEARRCLEQLGMSGLKFHPWLQGMSVCSSLLDRICAVAAEFDAPIFFHDGTPPFSNSEQIAALAIRNPATKVVLGHAGLLWNWRSALAFADVPNLYFCLCGPPLRVLEILCDRIPAEHLIWGSDYGFGLTDHIEYRLQLLQRANIPHELRQRILGSNALRLLPKTFKK